MDLQRLTLKSQEAVSPRWKMRTDAILVDARDGELVFEKASVAEPAAA